MKTGLHTILNKIPTLNATRCLLKSLIEITHNRKQLAGLVLSSAFKFNKFKLSWIRFNLSILISAIVACCRNNPIALLCKGTKSCNECRSKLKLKEVSLFRCKSENITKLLRRLSLIKNMNFYFVSIFLFFVFETAHVTASPFPSSLQNYSVVELFKASAKVSKLFLSGLNESIQ